jgi:hypothetical protein
MVSSNSMLKSIGVVLVGMDAPCMSKVTECVMSGRVIMNIMSKTSITSMSGVVFISDIGSLSAVEVKLIAIFVSPSKGVEMATVI